MKIRVVSDIKENTDLTDEEVIKNIPENLDPISTTDVKIRNYVIRYFIHKEEIIATEVKPLPEEVETNSNHKNIFLAFLKEQVPLMADNDVYTLYRTYKNKEFIAYVDENLEDYSKYREYVKVLKEEILQRCL